MPMLHTHWQARTLFFTTGTDYAEFISCKVCISTLAHQVCHELLGILQGVVEAEAFGERAAVLWNVLLVLLVAAAAIAAGLHTPLF